MIYIGSADSLVSCYPSIPENIPSNLYRRTELELFI